MKMYRFISKSAGIIIEYSTTSLRKAWKHLAKYGHVDLFPDLEFFEERNIEG